MRNQAEGSRNMGLSKRLQKYSEMPIRKVLAAVAHAASLLLHIIWVRRRQPECCTSMNDIRLMARTVERQKERRNVLYSFLIMRTPLTPGICVGNARFVQQPAYVTLEDLLVSKLSQKCISFHCDLFSVFVVSPCYMLGNRDNINTNTSLSQAFTTFLGG